MPAILFICTANQFRSPLAAACFQEAIKTSQLSGEWAVESAGTWAKAGLPAPEFCKQIARRIGIPLSESHRTRQLDQALLAGFDLVVVMEAGHKEALWIEFPLLRKKIFMLSEVVDGIQYDIPDPVAPGVNADEVARELKELIDKNVNKIARLAESLSAR